MQRDRKVPRSRIRASASRGRALRSSIVFPSSALVSLVASLALLAAPSTAHADDVELQATLIMGAAWTPSLPALTSPSTLTAAREISESSVKTGRPLVSVGGGFDLGVVLDDHYVIPGLGFAGYGAVGSYPSILTSADGSIARANPWTTYQVDLLLPGFGYRMKQRRFMFGASLRSGVSFMHMNGSIAGGAGETAVSLTGASILLQGEIEACRRLDPVTRICLQVSPRIYDFGFMNGATFGLRFEWGR